MLSIYDVLEYFEELNTTYSLGIDNFYCGKLDNKKLKSLGFYDLKGQAPIIPVGGIKNKTYKELNISLLIHYNKDYVQTEKISYKIYELLQNLNEEPNLKIKDFSINYIELLSSCEDVGTDDNGVYERVIQFRINYQI